MIFLPRHGPVSSLAVLFTLVLSVEFAVPHGVHAAPTGVPLGLDGSGLQNCGGPDDPYWSLTFDAANQNDILVTWISLASWYNVVSITDNNGLVWTERRVVNVYPTVGYEYFAKWAGSGFENITVQFSAPTSQCSIVAFGISGANFDSPFDPNPSIPSMATGSPGPCSDCYRQPSASINTDNSNDILLGLTTNNILPAYNPGQGFACIAGTCDGVGTAMVVAEYQVVTSTETKYPVSLTTYAGYSGLVADAVAGPANGESFSISLSECVPDCSASLTVQAGTSITRDVTVRSVNGFSGTVDLSATVTPIHYPSSYATSNLDVTLDPTSIYLSPGEIVTVSLTVTTSESTPSDSSDQALAATYTVTVTGTSRSQISSSLPLKVTPPPGFSIMSDLPHPYQWNPTIGNLVVQKGENTSSTLTLTSNYGFAGQVSLSVDVTPNNPPTVDNGPVLSLQDDALDLSSGGTATTGLNIQTDSTTTIGDYVVTVSGSSGSRNNNTKIFLTVRAPELDGVGTPANVGKYHPDCTCATQMLSTTQGGEAVIVLVECPYSQACANSSSVLDSSGLTFTQRVSSPAIAEYYSIASEPLESDNITVYTTQRCCWQMQAFAIAGVNTETVFDTDPSVPAIMSCSGIGLESCSASITTTGRDFIIAASAINDAGPCTTLSGFAGVGGFFGGGGSGDADYQVAEEAQSNLTFTCTRSDPLAILVDAVSLDARIQQVTVFDGLSLDLSGGLSSNTATKTLTGTISATVTDSATGQTVSSNTFKVSFSYGPGQTASFVLSISTSRYWLGATCTVNLSIDQASCSVSRSPDVNRDGTINILDLVKVALSYGSAQGDARYSPVADLNGDGKLSILDLAIVARDYQLRVFS